jgi:hypothetical protein
MKIAACGGELSQYTTIQTEVTVFKHMIWTLNIVPERCILWLNLYEENNWKVDNFLSFSVCSNVKIVYIIYTL